MNFKETFIERLSLLGLSVDKFKEITFVSSELIDGIISTDIDVKSIDSFDMEMICNTLKCNEKYFVDSNIKRNDLLISSLNRGNDTAESNIKKAQIQSFVKDFIFVNQLIESCGD